MRAGDIAQNNERDLPGSKTAKTRECGRLLPALVAAAGCLFSTPQAGQAFAQEFYRNKTVTIIVGNPAGSGYDAYGRLLARHMPKHLPGAPTMVVQNMPGAGSVRAADYTYNIAPGDGTAFALAMPGTLVEPLTGNAASYRYDPTRFAYLGTMDSGTRVCVTGPNSPTRSIADARQRKTVVAATAPGSSAFHYPRMLNAFAGTKLEIVTGYQGPADVFLAVDRGEAEGACGLDVSTFKSLRPEWLKQKKVNFLAQFGLEPNPELVALGMPTVWDLVSDPEDKKMLELVVSQQVFQRPFMAPPATPPQRIAELRAAFWAAMKDPDLVAEAAAQSLDLNPRSGEEVEALVKRMYATPKELLAKLAKVLQP